MEDLQSLELSAVDRFVKMAMASPYAVDRSRLARRGRGIVPVLEQRQRQRAPGSSTNSGPGSANIPMPQLSHLSQWQQISDQERETPRFSTSPRAINEPETGEIKDTKELGDPSDDEEKPDSAEVQVHGQAEPQINEETKMESGQNEETVEKDEEDGSDGNEMHSVGLAELMEPASRLPKPTEVAQGADGKSSARAKSSSKSSTSRTQTQGQRPVAKSRPRSAEKPQKLVLAQPARRLPPRPFPASPETRDIASSPMSPNSPIPVPGNTLQSESLSGLFRELGILRDDFIAAKLESERARERVQELEGENAHLRKQLQDAEKLNRKVLQQKQELEHTGDLWRQRWEDSQQQLEECWKRFDTLKVVKEAEQRLEKQNPATISTKSSVDHVDQSPSSGACQVELGSPTQEPPMPTMSTGPAESREVQDPPVAMDETAPVISSQPKSFHVQPPQTPGAPMHGFSFQTPPAPLSGFALAPNVALSPRTMPARPASFPSPRTQQAVRVVSVPQAGSNMYFSSQIPVQARWTILRVCQICMIYNIFNRLSASRHTTIALKLSLQFVRRQDLHLVTTGSVLADPLLLLTHLNFSQFAHHFCEASINARAVLRLTSNVFEPFNQFDLFVCAVLLCSCALGHAVTLHERLTNHVPSIKVQVVVATGSRGPSDRSI